MNMYDILQDKEEEADSPMYVAPPQSDGWDDSPSEASSNNSRSHSPKPSKTKKVKSSDTNKDFTQPLRTTPPRKNTTTSVNYDSNNSPTPALLSQICQDSTYHTISEAMRSAGRSLDHTKRALRQPTNSQNSSSSLPSNDPSIPYSSPSSTHAQANETKTSATFYTFRAQLTF
jgi:hypothetical protein